MFWMLVGGGVLFASIVAGVLLFMPGAGKRANQVSSAPATSTAAGIHMPEEPVPQRSDAAFLAEAEPLAAKFLNATRIEELLPLVHNPAVAEARMRRQYPNGKIEAPGMSAFDTQSGISRKGSIASLSIRTRDYEEKALAFFETPEGLRIDWESWVGWSEMPWEEFLASKPTTGKLFRLTLSPVEYYNMAFADDKKWQSYRLESPDGIRTLYGYAERGSGLDAELRPSPDIKRIALTLSLKFPENASSKNQVLIEKFVAEGWVLETEETP